MCTLRIREKKHRLERSEYCGQVEVVFAACLRGRELGRHDDKVVLANIEILAKAVRSKKCSAPVYCFMPDHLHVLIRGLYVDSDTWAAMVTFKVQSGVWFSKNSPSLRWQKDFYDHIVRNGEDAREQVRYIAANPCRAGLVDHWQEWHFTGSIDERVEDWLY